MAEKVRQIEQIVDDLNEQIFRELLTFMMEDSKSIHRALLIMQVSKNLERIADHAKGIADMVTYMVTGECVRHQTCDLKRKGAGVKRNLFYKIFFSYLVIICLSFFILNLFIKDEIKNVMTDKIEAELLTYAELIDLSSAKKMSDQLKQIARISGSTGYAGGCAGQGLC